MKEKYKYALDKEKTADENLLFLKSMSETYNILAWGFHVEHGKTVILSYG